MINAKEEFLRHIKEDTNDSTVKCAKIKLFSKQGNLTANLPVGYTPEGYLLFLEKINVEYNNGYGGQNLMGVIWYNGDLTWSTRGDYDRSGWWDFHEVPTVLPELINGNLP